MVILPLTVSAAKLRAGSSRSLAISRSSPPPVSSEVSSEASPPIEASSMPMVRTLNHVQKYVIRTAGTSRAATCPTPGLLPRRSGALAGGCWRMMVTGLGRGLGLGLRLRRGLGFGFGLGFRV
jgi:hypothetical protein